MQMRSKDSLTRQPAPQPQRQVQLHQRGQRHEEWHEEPMEESTMAHKVKQSTQLESTKQQKQKLQGQQQRPEEQQRKQSKGSKRHPKKSDKPASVSTKMHNALFYNLMPRAIECLAYCKLEKKLALWRVDNSIEIWNLESAAHLERVMWRAASPDAAVQALVWVGRRLFSVDLGGELIEWDLERLCPRRKQSATGNAIWCVDANAACNELALGTEEGHINIFDIGDDEMRYKRLFNKQEQRVICCRYEASGKFLVSGSVGLISVWDVSGGYALQRIRVGAGKKMPPVVIWTLHVLSDFTIIAGDSRGQLTLWNGSNGAHIDSLQVQSSDLVALCVNEREDTLVCAGLQPTLQIYAKTQVKREDMVSSRWVRFLQRSVHEHPVKSLICVGDRILSASTDGFLGECSMSKMKPTIRRFEQFPQDSGAVVVPDCRLLLLRYTDYLELWRMGTAGAAVVSSGSSSGVGVTQETRQLLQLEELPQKLLALKSRRSELIVCSAISRDGTLLCYSTASVVRVFRLTYNDDGIEGSSDDSSPVQLECIRELPQELMPATHMHFSGGRSQLLYVVSAVTRQVQAYAIAKPGSDMDKVLCCVNTIDTSKRVRDVVTHFVVSECGRWVVVVSAGGHGTIAVWDAGDMMTADTTLKHTHHVDLPRYTYPATAVALCPKRPILVAAYADGRVVEYDLEQRRFSCSDLVEMGQSCVRNIVLNVRQPNVYVMHSNSMIYVLEKCVDSDSVADVPDASAATKSSVGKKSRVANVNSPRPLIAGVRVKMQRPFEHLMQLLWLCPEELVAVGVDPTSLLSQMPPTLRRKRFGIS